MRGDTVQPLASLPPARSDLEHWAREAARGFAEFEDVLEVLVAAEMERDQVGGFLEIEERVGSRLLEAITAAEREMVPDHHAIYDRARDELTAAATRAAFAGSGDEAGKAMAEVRPDMSARMAKLLGIDVRRRLSEDEIGNLLGATRTDGSLVEGRRRRSAIVSVGEAFGLAGVPERQKGIDAKPPRAEEVDNILAGKRADGNPPRSEVGKLLQPDVVEGALKRFRSIYGLPGQGEITPEQLAHMREGRLANGLNLNDSDYRRGVNATNERITYWDFTVSAPKSLSVAWGLSDNEPERAILMGVLRDANQAAMRHLADRVGYVRRGNAGEKGVEKAAMTWLSFSHTTSRPTVDLARVDKAGESYTDTREVPLLHPDMQLHFHNAAPNVLQSERSGHVGSLDGNRLAGEIKVSGAVAQAYMARYAREHGIAVSYDGATGSVRLDAIPKPVEEHYSKRTREGAHHARELVAELKREGGRVADWDDMSAEQQAAFLKSETLKHRSRKNKQQDPTGDRLEWQRQAGEIGYQHPGVLREGPITPELDQAARHELAYELGVKMLDVVLQKDAVISSDRLREITARTLVSAGIGDNAEADIHQVMQLYYSRGVTLHGQQTKLLLVHTLGDDGQDRWSVTTALKETEENRLIELAQRASADRSDALTPAQINRAAEAYLARSPHVDRDGPQWREQRPMMDAMDAAKLTIGQGVAGSGKTRSVLGPLADAWRADGRHVIGIALANRTASDFADAGISGDDRMSVRRFLRRVENNKLRLNSKSVVVIDEVGMLGTRDLLSVVEATSAAGALLRMFGDPKQARAVEAGEVYSLLERALPGRIPGLLISGRQKAERDRATADLLRQGRGADAIARKIEDGALHIVAGGKDATIGKAVELWQRRMDAHRGEDGYRLLMMTNTNEAARKIGGAIRQIQREAGDLGPDLHTMKASNPNGETYEMKLARGDIVRLYTQVHAPNRKIIASNGEALTVLDASDVGLRFRNNRSGDEGFVRWKKLRAEAGRPVQLSYASASTINLAQGVTATDAIPVLVDGTKGMDAYRAYVAESRHVESSAMIIDEASVRKDIDRSRPRGTFEPIRRADIIQRIGENLSRQPEKLNATDSIRNALEVRRYAERSLRLADVPAQPRPIERATDLVLRAYHRRRLEVSHSIQRVVRIARQLPQQLTRVVDRHEREQRQERGHGLSL